MKIVLLIKVTITALLMSLTAQASDDMAEYTVPVPDNLVEYSRFFVKINKPYGGDNTQSISYTFPEELTGFPPLTVNLKRIPQTQNSWESPELTAHCTTLESWFSCNIHLKKQSALAQNLTQKASVLQGLLGGTPFLVPQTQARAIAINKDNVVEFLTSSAISPKMLQGQLDVLDIFLSSEPAGILSYEF